MQPGEHSGKSNNVQVDLHKLYCDAEEMKPLLLDNSCKMLFTSELKYLGSLITFQLTDSADIRARIQKANKAMGALAFIWKSPEIDLHTKCLLYKAIPLNLLVWGAENWAQMLRILPFWTVFITDP